MTDQEYDALINSMSSGSPSWDDLDFRDLTFDFDTSGADFGNLDLSGLSGMDFSSTDFGDFDFGSGFDLGNLDLSGLSGMDFDFGGIDGGADLDSLIDSMGGQSLEGLEDVEFGDALALADMGDFDRLNTYGMTPEQLSNRDELMALGGQDFGSSVDMGKSMGDFNTNMQDIFDNGGFTSQWQNVDGRKVQVYDDGTGMAINPSTGASRSLSEAEVISLIKGGKLNTAASGYNAATGGTKIAPGGGASVILKDGSKGTLLTTGRVIDDKGTVIGKEEDVKTKIINTGNGDKDTPKPPDRPGTPGKPTTPTTPTKTDGFSSLIPLLLALLAMNRGGGGGGESKNAVIPGLTATQRQTPYAQQQRAPGYRPGQGGVSYFDQTQYTPRMAAGGGIARLLDGPGDGVSDSIPAVIDEGMAGGGQPAKVARGEYIFDARSVAALGNGSTDAGAERLDKMREDILRDDRKAKIGEDSKAYRHLLA
jgi:hypothetical protein